MKKLFRIIIVIAVLKYGGEMIMDCRIKLPSAEDCFDFAAEVSESFTKLIGNVEVEKN